MVPNGRVLTREVHSGTALILKEGEAKRADYFSLSQTRSRRGLKPVAECGYCLSIMMMICTYHPLGIRVRMVLGTPASFFAFMAFIEFLNMEITPSLSLFKKLYLEEQFSALWSEASKV